MFIEICVFNYKKYHVKPQLLKDSTKKSELLFPLWSQLVWLTYRGYEPKTT